MFPPILWKGGKLDGYYLQFRISGVLWGVIVNRYLCAIRGVCIKGLRFAIGVTYIIIDWDNLYHYRAVGMEPASNIVWNRVPWKWYPIADAGPKGLGGHVNILSMSWGQDLIWLYLYYEAKKGVLTKDTLSECIQLRWQFVCLMEFRDFVEKLPVGGASILSWAH